MSDLILAAGAVVWRRATDELSGGRGPSGVEILLVHRPKYDDWSLPKGKRERGEHILLTAVREVFEETGVRSALGPRLPSVEYQNGVFRKRIDYWSMFSPGEADSGFTANHEVDEVSWLPLAQASQRLTYPRDEVVIAGLRPRATVPLILLRHASAGQKENWPADDESRPLDAKGEADALALAGLLPCFAPSARVLSSPALRCTESVRPYAEAFGGTVDAEAALALSGRSGNSSSGTNRGDALADLVRNLVAVGGPAVLCLHRENLPKALAAACAALGAPAPPEAPDLPLPKGGFWVVHIADGELAGLECYVP
ncbi:MAG TPA: NUDIX hydrolase [Streptosporangiaceae bacterium]|nr:NUDIX hydrolase [Streptosporangiaceae bacterium]